MKQGDVWLVALEPVKGSEIGKTRPCVIVSPDQLNDHLRTVVVVPMTTILRNWPYRVTVQSGGKNGQVTADQIRCVAKPRLCKHLGKLKPAEIQAILRVLQNMFA